MWVQCADEGEEGCAYDLGSAPTNMVGTSSLAAAPDRAIFFNNVTHKAPGCFLAIYGVLVVFLVRAFGREKFSGYIACSGGRNYAEAYSIILHLINTMVCFTDLLCSSSRYVRTYT